MPSHRLSNNGSLFISLCAKLKNNARYRLGMVRTVADLDSELKGRFFGAKHEKFLSALPVMNLFPLLPELLPPMNIAVLTL